MFLDLFFDDFVGANGSHDPRHVQFLALHDSSALEDLEESLVATLSRVEHFFFLPDDLVIELVRDEVSLLAHDGLDGVPGTLRFVTVELARGRLVEKL